MQMIGKDVTGRSIYQSKGIRSWNLIKSFRTQNKSESLSSRNCTKPKANLKTNKIDLIDISENSKKKLSKPRHNIDVRSFAEIVNRQLKKSNNIDLNNVEFPERFDINESDESSTRNILPILNSTKSMKSLSITGEVADEDAIMKLGIHSETTRANFNCAATKNHKNKAQIKYLAPKPPKPFNNPKSESFCQEKQEVNESQPNQTNSDEIKESSTGKYSKNFSPCSKNPIAMTKIDLSNHVNFCEETPKNECIKKSKTFAIDEASDIKFNKNAIKQLLSPYKTPKSDNSSLSKSLSECTIQKSNPHKFIIPKTKVSNLSKQFEEKKLNSKTKFDQKVVNLSLELQDSALNHPEFPDYIGFYFRDYYQILEKQARKGANTPDLFETDINSELNFVSFKQTAITNHNPTSSDNILKSSNVSEHKFKLNPHFKSFNGEDIKLLNDSNKDCRVNITVGNIKNADIILPDQSNDIKKKNHEHVIHCAQGLKACKSKELPKGIVQLGNNEIIQKNHDQNLKLLVFDLDETLMHTVHHFEDDNVENHKIDKEFDFKLPILYPNGKTKYICINMRPYVKEVLHLLKKYYRIVIFTASVPSYADTILNFIDPSNSIFEARYYRSHCLASKDRIHIKDMRLFEQPNSKNDKNWDLKDIVIVDNASHSFAYQVNNGYPILPFYSDKQDKEMIHLYHYLKRLADHDDVRPVIAKTFVLDKLLQERISELIDGIIEYSVQEMTDEDMMLFDKYFSSQNESIQNLSSFELEQGQSVETTINADITNTNDDNFEEIVDVIHVEVDDNFQQENYNTNKSCISIPKERYSIDVENFKRSYHLHNNGSQGEVKVSESAKKTKISQKLDEYRKKYLGNKLEEKETPIKKQVIAVKNNFVTPGNRVTKEMINKRREEILTIQTSNTPYLNDVVNNVQVLSPNISRGESCVSQRQWSKSKGRSSETITSNYAIIVPRKTEDKSKTLKDKHKYRTNRNKAKRT